MTIVAIDPGNTQSAVVRYDPALNIVTASLYADNVSLLAWLGRRKRDSPSPTLVIEMIESFGMPVGAEVFQTCVWIGRFIQAWHDDAWHDDAQMLYRSNVKLHLCGTSRAKDSNVRAALIGRFGGSRARGTKKAPGRLYGISGDKWSALAVAVTWAETRGKKDENL